MSNPANLTVNVDISKVEEAIEALNRLADVAERAVAAMEKLGGAPVSVQRVGEVEYMKIGVQ